MPRPSGGRPRRRRQPRSNLLLPPSSSKHFGYFGVSSRFPQGSRKDVEQELLAQITASVGRQQTTQGGSSRGTSHGRPPRAASGGHGPDTNSLDEKRLRETLRRSGTSDSRGGWLMGSPQHSLLRREQTPGPAPPSLNGPYSSLALASSSSPRRKGSPRGQLASRQQRSRSPARPSSASTRSGGGSGTSNGASDTPGPADYDLRPTTMTYRSRKRFASRPSSAPARPHERYGVAMRDTRSLAGTPLRVRIGHDSAGFRVTDPGPGRQRTLHDVEATLAPMHITPGSPEQNRALSDIRRVVNDLVSGHTQTPGPGAYSQVYSQDDNNHRVTPAAAAAAAATAAAAPRQQGRVSPGSMEAALPTSAGFLSNSARKMSATDFVLRHRTDVQSARHTQKKGAKVRSKGVIHSSMVPMHSSPSKKNLR